MTKSLLLMFVLLGLSSAVYGDQTLNFDSVSGTYGGHQYVGEAYGGPYYVSPYFGSIGANTAGSTVLFCLDFDHYINVPDHTTAVFRTLPTDPTDPTLINQASQHFQFGNISVGSGQENFINGALPITFSGSVNTGANISSLTVYQRYEAAIYLLYDNLTLPGPPIFSDKKRAEYQYAMWAIFLQNGNSSEGSAVYKSAIQNINSSDNTFEGDVNALVLGAFSEVTNSANQSFLTSLLPYFTLIDSTTNPSTVGNKYQEFLSPTVIPPDFPGVPEPSSVVLFGTMVVAIALVLRRRQTA